MPKTILFYDGVCPNAYSSETLQTRSLGGTEASCARITAELAKTHHVVLAQRGRTYSEDVASVVLVPLDTLPEDPDVVFTMRDAGHYVANIGRYPKATHYLWMHDVVAGQYTEHLMHHLHHTSTKMLCVSQWHKQQILQALPGIKLDIQVIYGPLAEYCTKTGESYDPYKLIFFSSPHKGLEHVLQVFKKLREKDPKFTLYVANPGYFKSMPDFPDNVVHIGESQHKDLINHVRTSLCTFYPNISFQETFGLVFAESNAVGTPVIAHPIGAAQEVLQHPGQLLDCRNHAAVIETVLRWQQSGRPIVRGRPEFQLKEVIQKWKKLISVGKV